MHDSPRYGMLDGRNRLHAVDNVVVADASSFTTGVEKNPTLTTMALASRAAELLAHDLKRGAVASGARPSHAVPALRHN
jgi:choline dehydrogenase-like flavoprotein